VCFGFTHSRFPQSEKYLVTSSTESATAFPPVRQSAATEQEGTSMSFRNQIYLRRAERRRGRWEYTVGVPLGNGKEHSVIVSEAIYNVIDELAKQDIRLAHQIERHNEYSELTDESLYERAFEKPKSLEDTVLDSLFVEQVLSIIKTLPSVQAKRFVLRNILGLTYPEIAQLEGCSARAAKESVDRAIEKIRKIVN